MDFVPIFDCDRLATMRCWYSDININGCNVSVSLLQNTGSTRIFLMSPLVCSMVVFFFERERERERERETLGGNSFCFCRELALSRFF